jgi:uncharacterized protein (DUF1800 family)
MKFGHVSRALALSGTILLASCGGASGGGQGSEAIASPTTPKLASRFLAQASFGPTRASIDEVTNNGVEAWLTAQFAKPQILHRAYVEQVKATLAAGASLSVNQYYESFWQQAITGDDQLRQRVAFALSQIFVVSLVDTSVAARPLGVASYYDVLGQNAFGNFRTLLEGVARHPMMGIYLSYLKNQKESATREPDENFAREVMQLMTIGLYQLNADGSVKMSNGKPIETYTHDDVSGLAKVFTGWSWAGPDTSGNRFSGKTADPDREWMPMQNYPNYHSTSPKSFLGTTVSAGGTGESDLKQALDTLFNHPNVGPFIGRQLIQHLVTSNPSPAYVSRVAAAFADNGAGVRGDMKAVLQAILLDSEARSGEPRQKVREPVLRLANWMRAFNAKSVSGRFLLSNLDDPLTGLAQTPMRAPSVFGFFRPAYVPPNTSIASAGLVAPEMQIVGEPSVTGYLNMMQDIIPKGTGTGRDVLPDYAAEVALAEQPDKLLDRIDLLLLNGAMSATLRSQILAAVNSVTIPTATGSNATAIANAKNNRVYLGIFLAMASPEYIVQK